jgi:hypothetical protein
MCVITENILVSDPNDQPGIQDGKEDIYRLYAQTSTMIV